MRRLILALLAAALLVGPTVLAFFSGGFFDAPRLVAAVGAWLLLVVAAVVAPVPLPRSAAGRVALAGLAGLTAWTGASIAWAPLSEAATDDLQRLLLYLGAFAAALALLRDPAVRRAVEPALAAGALVVVGWGLAGRLLPGVIHQSHSTSALGRLEQPLTYWNAMGVVAAVGLVLCLRLAGDESRRRAIRALGGAAGVPLAVGTYLSFSRGALIAGLVGCGLLIVLVRSRAQRRPVAVTLAAGAAAALVANALPAVRALEGGNATAEGLVMLAALIALAAAAAFLQLWAEVDPRRDRALVAAGAVLLAGCAIALAVTDHEPQRDLRGARVARLGSLETSRTEYWKAAFQGFEREPVRGLGSGAFRVEWLRDRHIPERARDAHSLYVETLSELGAVGFALLAAFVGGVAAAARRALRTNRLAAAGPVAALGAFALHAGVDWDWEMPAVTLPALLLAALLVGIAEQPADDEGPGDEAGAPASAQGASAAVALR